MSRDYLDLEEQRLQLDREEQGKVAFQCDRCGRDIYDGEEYYCREGDWLCEECFDELQKDEKYECRMIAGDDDDF